MPHPSNRQRQRETAIAAVRAAATVCQRVAQNLKAVGKLEKQDRSPVTVADFASQAVVAARMARDFPDDEVVGEEQSDQLRQASGAPLLAAVHEQVAAVAEGAGSSQNEVLDLIDRCGAPADGPRYWTLDPIDGTKGFLRGGQYAIALALIEDHQVVLGVLGCPNLAIDQMQGVLLVAEAGSGTVLLPLNGDDSEGRAMRVSSLIEPDQARFCESVESAHSSHDDAVKLAEKLGITAAPLRMDSQAKYAAVASGQAQIYLRLPTRTDYREYIWDHAAGMIAVTEAGGRVSDVYGRALDFSKGRRLEANRGIIATNGAVHDAVAEAVGEVLGGA